MNDNGAVDRQIAGEEAGNTTSASASSDDPIGFSFERSYAPLNRFGWSPAGAA